MSAWAGRVGKPGGRSAALHVHKNAGRLGHRGVADVLHHEREARPGGDRERLGAAPDRALDGDGSRQFVFHLDEHAAYRGDAGGKALHHLGRGRDGISCGKSRTGCESSLTASVITVEKMNTRENALRISVHVALRRWRNPGSTSRTGRSRCTSPRRRRGVGDNPWNCKQMRARARESGRIRHRIRNPYNVPPLWRQSLWPREPSLEISGLLLHATGQIGQSEPNNPPGI